MTEDRALVSTPPTGARVQLVASSRRVTVTVDGIVVAESHRPLFLHEADLPRRTYLPAPDVRTDLLTPTDTRTTCPHKGTARYWTLVTPQSTHVDIAWSYPTPIPAVAAIAGLLAFYDDRVELTID